MNVGSALCTIAFGAFYQIIFPALKLCVTVCCMYFAVSSQGDKDLERYWNDVIKAFGIFEAIFESLPQVSIKITIFLERLCPDLTVSMWFQTVIQWQVIGSGLVVYADWSEMPLNSWEMAVVSATVSTGSVIYNTVIGLPAFYGLIK